MSKNKKFKAKKLSPEDAKRLTKMDRIPYGIYEGLVKMGKVISWVKFRGPRTIFYDYETNVFVYVNKFWGRFAGCGVWEEDYDPDYKKLGK